MFMFVFNVNVDTVSNVSCRRNRRKVDDWGRWVTSSSGLRATTCIGGGTGGMCTTRPNWRRVRRTPGPSVAGSWRGGGGAAV